MLTAEKNLYECRLLFSILTENVGWVMQSFRPLMAGVTDVICFKAILTSPSPKYSSIKG
jgi:hypothetical protein